MSISDIIAPIKHFLPEQKSLPKFGQGVPQQERLCEQMTVYMTSYEYKYGGYTGDRRRKIMDTNATLQQAKDQFGTKVEQQLILDENGFMFHPEDVEKP